MEPVKMKCRCYKHFVAEPFRSDLSNTLQYHAQDKMTYDVFHDSFMQVLNSHAPQKQRFVRDNEQPFMNKVLSKAFMYRSRLKNLYNKNPTDINQANYKKQRDFCVTLIAKEKKKFYNNLDLSKLDNNKKFWQKVKPLFSNKNNVSQKNIVIVEDDNYFKK